VHLGKQPAKGAVTPDLLFHIARKGNAGLAQRPRPPDIEKDIRDRMFEPVYVNYA
jgi:hypothetical protein